MNLCLYFPFFSDNSLKMNSYDELLSILNGVIDASHRLNKMEIKDIKKQTLELENVLSKI